jgi:hypothetical protein
MTFGRLFNKGDVLSFQYSDKTYGLTIVTDIYSFPEYKNDYGFYITRYRNEKEPTVNDINKIKLVGFKLPRITEDAVKRINKETEEHLKIEGIYVKFTPVYAIVFCTIGLKHIILKKRLNRFKIIGNVVFKETEHRISKDRVGNFLMAGTLENFYEEFNRRSLGKEYPIVDFIK